MKQRVISAGIGLIVLAVVIFFYDTLLFNIAIGFISVLAVFELLNATKMLKHRDFAALAGAFALLMSFAQHHKVRPLVPLLVLLLLIAFVILTIKNYDTVQFEQASMTVLVGVVVPLFFSSAVYIRDQSGVILGLYYLLLALGSAWLCDTGAYFTGYFLGKRKMAPNISPNKTVEGAVGGVIVAIALNLLLALGYSKGMNAFGQSIEINYLLVGILSPFFAGLGMLGDLLASTIKRQHQIKDYGHIMPGHGGIMDRFDSVLLTLPAVYIAILYLPIAVV